jgi:hypothetical protein
MARIVEPALADLQFEYARALEAGRLWRARWIRLSGSIGLGRALTIHAVHGLFAEWPSDERRSAMRITLMVAGVTLAVMAALVARPAMSNMLAVPHKLLVLLLVPQAVPVALPIGCLVGILWGHGSRALSRRVAAAVIALALAAAALSFVTVGWVAPTGIRMFRTQVFQMLSTEQNVVPDAVRGPRSREGVRPAKGESEMTLGELADWSGEVRRHLGPTMWSRVRYDYQLRWALSAAAPMLALLAFGAIRRRERRSRSTSWALLTSLGLVAYYYAFLTYGASLAGNLPILGAWLANLASLALAAAFLAQAAAPAERRTTD